MANQESDLDIYFFSYWVYKGGLLKPLRTLYNGTKKKREIKSYDNIHMS